MGKWFKHLFIVGLVVTIIGAVVLAGARLSLNSQSKFGDLLAILMATFYTLSNIFLACFGSQL